MYWSLWTPLISLYLLCSSLRGCWIRTKSVPSRWAPSCPCGLLCDAWIAQEDGLKNSRSSSVAWESFSCKHYLILITIFLQIALTFIQGVWCNSGKKKSWLLQICLKKKKDQNGSFNPKNVFLSVHLRKIKRKKERKQSMAWAWAGPGSFAPVWTRTGRHLRPSSSSGLVASTGVSCSDVRPRLTKAGFSPGFSY